MREANAHEEAGGYRAEGRMIREKGKRGREAAEPGWRRIPPATRRAGREGALGGGAAGWLRRGWRAACEPPAVGARRRQEGGTQGSRG